MSLFFADVSEIDFEAQVIQGSDNRLVVVDFWAPWCAPCRRLKPMLEKLAEEYQGRFFLVKVDADANKNLTLRYGVRSIPTVKAFLDGKLIDEFSGALSEAYVREFLEKYIPSPVRRLLTEARAAVTQGQHDQALSIFKQVLSLDPNNGFAKIEIAALLLERNQIDAALALGLGLTGDILDYERTQQVLAKLRLAEQSRLLPGETILRAMISQGGEVAQARIDLATVLSAQGEYQAALDELLAVLHDHPDFGDGLARKNMLTLFDFLGTSHPLVDEYRRKMALALH